LLIRLVVFDGAKTFLGIHSRYWVLFNNSWWVQFASYFGILFFVVLLLFSQVVLGDAAFKWGDLHEVMMTSRKSPPSEPRVEMEEEELNKKFWKRNLVAASNALP
jgi:amino acid permease